MTKSTHDVAISAVVYDSILVAELSERLAARVDTGTYWRSETDDISSDATVDLAAASVIETSARVVVVLHQRLWSRSGITAVEAEALRARIHAKRPKSICVVKLDDEPVPSWLRTARHCVLSEIGLDAVVNTIAACVVAAGGSVSDAPDAAPVEAATDRPVWGSAPPSFMAQPRAQSAFKREFDALSAELAERVQFESDRLGDRQVEMHCAPERLVVQLGPVGLSMSWVAGRSGNLADGRLLVIEWDGPITHRRAMGDGKTASMVREQLYRADAKGPDDWRWRPEGSDGSSYSSRNLAGQCFTSVNLGRSA
jgi:hypothetical protein